MEKLIKLDLENEWTPRHEQKATEFYTDLFDNVPLNNEIDENQSIGFMKGINNSNIKYKVLALIYKFENETKFNKENFEKRLNYFLDTSEKNWAIDTENLETDLQNFFGTKIRYILKNFQIFANLLNQQGKKE